MANIEIFDAETNKPVGKKEVPERVLAAAATLYSWLKKQPAPFIIHGVKLADD